MRAGRPRHCLELSTEERTQLESIAASRSLPHGLVRRAQMVLWTESGMTNRDVARRLKVSQPTVSFWRGRFGERRVAGLHDELKPGRPRTHSDERLARLLKTALAEQPKSGTHWSVRGLERRTGISKSAVQRYLNFFGVQPYRARSFKLSSDPFFVEKVRDIVGLYLNPPEHARCSPSMRRARFRPCDLPPPALPGFGS